VIGNEATFEKGEPDLDEHPAGAVLDRMGTSADRPSWHVSPRSVLQLLCALAHQLFGDDRVHEHRPAFLQTGVYSQ
jgi:hypothetical protein